MLIAIWREKRPGKMEEFERFSEILGRGPEREGQGAEGKGQKNGRQKDVQNWDTRSEMGDGYWWTAQDHDIWLIENHRISKRSGKFLGGGRKEKGKARKAKDRKMGDRKM